MSIRSSLLLPVGLPTNGFPGQLSGHDHAAGGGLPGQDPNVAMLNDMMQVSGLKRTHPEVMSHLSCVTISLNIVPQSLQSRHKLAVVAIL